MVVITRAESEVPAFHEIDKLQKKLKEIDQALVSGQTPKMTREEVMEKLKKKVQKRDTQISEVLQNVSEDLKNIPAVVCYLPSEKDQATGQHFSCLDRVQGLEAFWTTISSSGLSVSKLLKASDKELMVEMGRQIIMRWTLVNALLSLIPLGIDIPITFFTTKQMIKMLAVTALSPSKTVGSMQQECRTSFWALAGVRVAGEVASTALEIAGIVTAGISTPIAMASSIAISSYTTMKIGCHGLQYFTGSPIPISLLEQQWKMFSRLFNFEATSKRVLNIYNNNQHRLDQVSFDEL